MEILIFSDSHGRTEEMSLALEYQPTKPAAVIHLGDGVRDAGMLDLKGIPLYTVRGNCDTFLFESSVPCPEECLTSIGGRLIFMTHGAKYCVKSGLGGLLAEAARKNADVVLFGHTHRPYEEVIPSGTELGGTVLEHPLYVFNPGSIGRRTDRLNYSFGVMTLNGDQILLSHGMIG